MNDPVRTLVEKDRVIDAINQLFIYTDRRDWSGVRSVLAETVLMDDFASRRAAQPTKG
jgi:hypothetical protein